MEPTISAPGKSSEVYPVLVNKDLLKLISSVKMEISQGLSTTWHDLLDGLKMYIFKHGLYDKKNPFYIKLGDNKLGSVLGQSEFTLTDVTKILQKFVIPVSSKVRDSPDVICSYTVNETVLKRKVEDDDNDGAKKQCWEAAYDSESESVYSIQGYETEFAKDTSDISDFYYFDETNEHNLPSGSIVTVEETFDLEYEVQSDSSESNNENDNSSSESDFEDAINSILTFICKSDSDQEFWADDSSDDSNSSSFDAEIPEEDKWECKTCSTFNEPLMRFCAGCWRLRKSWCSVNERSESIPRKRKPRTRRRKKAKDVNKESLSNTNHFDMPSTSQESISSTSFPCGVAENESGIKKQELNDAKLCIICCSNPVNSSIIHGKFGHSISCYRCARRLQKKDERCPICRRKIERVVYLIST